MKLRYAAALMALLTMVGCSTGGNQPLPTVVLGSSPDDAATTQPATVASSRGVTASAVVIPREQAMVSPGLSGRIAAVGVSEGDKVRAGQTLLTLCDTGAQASVAQAQAALDAAKANHALLLADPSEATVRQAQAAVDAAQATLDGLKAQPRAETVAQAEANWVSAQAALAALLAGPSEHDLEAAQLRIEEARGALWAAQSTRDATCGSRALSESQCDSAEAGVLVAEAAVKQAELALRTLEEGATDEAITQARQTVRATEAQRALAREPLTSHDLDVARAQVKQAQATLDALLENPSQEQIAASQALVVQAEVALRAAETQLGRLAITAPIDGSVVDLSAHDGQWLVPGQPLASLADLSAFLVETTDLSELDVHRIAVGSQADVEIEALGLTVGGLVQEIAALADTLGGDVVYRAKLALDEQPQGLRAGMSAEVRFR